MLRKEPDHSHKLEYPSESLLLSSPCSSLATLSSSPHHHHTYINASLPTDDAKTSHSSSPTDDGSSNECNDVQLDASTERNPCSNGRASDDAVYDEHDGFKPTNGGGFSTAVLKRLGNSSEGRFSKALETPC